MRNRKCPVGYNDGIIFNRLWWKVQILSSNKKAVQVTAAIVVAVIAMVGFYGYQQNQQQRVKPQQLLERLMLVAGETAQISAVDYNQQSLAEQKTAQILNQLQQDLAAVKGLEAQTSAQYLLSEASAFLMDTESFEAWLSSALSQLWQQDSDWQIETVSKTERNIIAAGSCLTLTQSNGRWQLSAITQCEPLAS